MMDDDHTAETAEFPWESSCRTLLEQLADGDLRCGLTFAGQANPYLDEIIELHADNAGSSASPPTSTTRHHALCATSVRFMPSSSEQVL